MQSVIGEGWRRLAIYLPLSSSVLQNGWSIVFKTSLLFWLLMRSRSSQMLDIIFPLISLIYTDIPRIRAYLCYLWESLFPLITLIYTDIPRICVHPSYLWEINNTLHIFVAKRIVV